MPTYIHFPAGDLTPANGVVVSGSLPFTFPASAGNRDVYELIASDLNPVAVSAADTTPEPFEFTDRTDQALSTMVWSAPITVSGIDSPAPISVSGGQYRINGGAGTADAGTVSNGDMVAAGVMSSAANVTDTNVTVSIGGVSDTFTATTEASAATAPAQASAPTLTTGDALITISLAADPDDGGSAITRDDIRYSTDESTWTEVLDFTSGDDISSLTNDTEYFVQSRAINAFGAGAWSASASATPTASASPTLLSEHIGYWQFGDDNADGYVAIEGGALTKVGGANITTGSGHANLPENSAATGWDTDVEDPPAITIWAVVRFANANHGRQLGGSTGIGQEQGVAIAQRSNSTDTRGYSSDGTSGNNVSLDAAIVPDEWFFVCYTNDGTNAKIFRTHTTANVRASGAIPYAPSPTNKISIGKAVSGGGGPFDDPMGIASFGIMSRAISVAEEDQLFLEVQADLNGRVTVLDENGAASSLSVDNDGAGISASGLGTGAFSVAISGSSIAAHNATFTQDTQGRPLTRELLQSERVLFLVAPDLAVQTDVASNSLADPLDTIGLNAPALKIYDADQGVPASPTFEHLRDGTSVTGETDPAARVLTAADILTSATVRETYGGQTIVSNALSVQDADPLDVDPGALVHYDPTTVVLSGSDVTAWEDKLGTYDLDTVPTGGDSPTYDAADAEIDFDSTQAQGLVSSIDGPINQAFRDGKSVRAYIAMRNGINTSGYQVAFAETRGSDNSGEAGFGIQTLNLSVRAYVNIRETNGDGNRAIAGGPNTNIELTNPPSPDGALRLWEFDMDLVEQVMTIKVNGVLEHTEAYGDKDIFDADLDNEPPAFGPPEVLSVGGRYNATTNNGREFDGSIKQIYVTTTRDPAALALIEAEIASNAGVTLP